MSRGFQVLSLILIAGLRFEAYAQLDSSSAVLLRSGGKGGSQRPLDSGRYKIRAPENRKDDDDFDERPGTMIPSPVPSKTTRVKVSTPKNEINATSTSKPANDNAGEAAPVVPAPVTEPASDAQTIATPVETPPAPSSAPEEKTKTEVTPVTAPVAETPNTVPETKPVTEQVKQLFLGSEEDIDEYKKAVHREDPRSNIIDISLAPAYFYNGSKSSYLFHNYNTQGTGFGLGVNFWLTPFFGLHSDFFSSVSASVKNAGSNAVSLDRQDFNGGFRFRKHFGTNRKSPYLSWGLDYHDSSTKISKQATEAVGRRASGLSLTLEGVVPTSVVYAHTFKIDVRPRLHHSETSTGVEVKSGSKNTSNSIGLSLGGQWTLDRKNQVFWHGRYSVEQTLYEGDASQADPRTGVTPNGVSTTDSLLMFYFGFKWGS